MKVGIEKGKILNIFKENKRNFEIVELVNFDDAKLSEVDAVVSGKLSNKQLENATNLKYIFIPFTGKNGFDLDKINQLGIKIYVSHAHSKFVAERALGLTMNLLGKLSADNSKMRDGNWGERDFDIRVPWVTLYNKNVGIYGYGEIGKNIHKLISPFTDKVYAFNRSRKEEVNYVDSLNDLVDKSDIIFISAPLTDETEGSFNKGLLDKMSGKYLINVGRGKIIDEKSLYDALKNNTLSGFASDVWYNYPKGSMKVMPSNFPLENFNVVMTPHNGGEAENSAELRYLDTLNKINNLAKEIN